MYNTTKLSNEVNILKVWLLLPPISLHKHRHYPNNIVHIRLYHMIYLVSHLRNARENAKFWSFVNKILCWRLPIPDFQPDIYSRYLNKFVMLHLHTMNATDELFNRSIPASTGPYDQWTGITRVQYRYDTQTIHNMSPLLAY